MMMMMMTIAQGRGPHCTTLLIDMWKSSICDTKPYLGD